MWLTALGAALAGTPTPPTKPDIPPVFTAPGADFDYLKRGVMIPMRDRDRDRDRGRYRESASCSSPYRKATQKVFHVGGAASFIDLPVVADH